MVQRNGTHNTEHCVPFTTILNGLVNDPMLGSNLVSSCLGKVSHSGIKVAEVYLRKALIEKNFCRIKFELEADLFVIADDEKNTKERASVNHAFRIP